MYIYIYIYIYIYTPIKAPSHFAEVISAIDKMIAVLDAEEADDIAIN